MFKYNMASGRGRQISISRDYTAARVYKILSYSDMYRR